MYLPTSIFLLLALGTTAQSWRDEGLQAITVRGMDVAYVQPGASLQAYQGIFLKPVTVSFQKHWERSAAIPTGTRVNPRDTDRIRKETAEVVDREIRREFGKAGWRVVDAPGAGVLEVEVQVLDLYLNAPDLQTASRTESYARSFGRMTLVGELRDSATGAVVMRVLDRTIGHDHATFERTGRVENAREVGMVANEWARSLRRQLELARVAVDGSNSRP